MGLQDRKLAVLRKLTQESEPITLSELVEKLEVDYTARTVRRWLNLLVEEGFVQKSGHTKRAKYLAIKGKRDNSHDSNAVFGSESQLVLNYLKSPIFQRLPVAYNEKWFESYKPNRSYYLSASLRRQLFLAGRRSSNRDPAGTYAHQIFNRLLIDLSYNSS